MVDISPEKRPSAEDVLASPILKQEKVLEESVKQFYEEFREIHYINKGNHGTVNLVERKADKKRFAAKKNIGTREFDLMKAERDLLKKLRHKNIVEFIGSFETFEHWTKEIILVIEYCPCKFLFLHSLT